MAAHTNQLIHSTSPYLLQHAHNPVEWHPWGKEALEKARREDKPILLSIGYSTCYWCHVMEREVFENAEIASQMNRHFINIKVDREERPDLDDIYMIARQLLTQEGGWPNNIFLTSDLKPFFAGGTFSSERKYGRHGFPEVLTAITENWIYKRNEVLTTADTVTEQIKAVLDPPRKAASLLPEQSLINNLARRLKEIHDHDHGGFQLAPKFPHETSLLFLMDFYRLTGDQALLTIITRSLDAMAAGGIFDHVGGGFHRYAVDQAWQVPHFEKMLYTQALLALCYTEAFGITKKSYYEAVVRSTLGFVRDQMTGHEGGFYSAYDAETDGEEGAYYLFDEKEIRHILSPGAAQIFFYTFGLADVPQFPGHKPPRGKVIYAKKPLDKLARERGLPYDGFQETLDKILGKLLLSRQHRPMPRCDTKIIASWNGLMIDAFARAGRMFGDAKFVSAAEHAGEFILNRMVKKNQLYRVWHKGHADSPGFLEDYVYVVRGFVSLYRTTGKESWLIRAIDLINTADDLFRDVRRGGFYFNAEAKDLIVPIKTAEDSALPSANAGMVQVLADLANLTRGTAWEGEVWESRAQEVLRVFSSRLEDAPEAHIHMLHGLLRLLSKGNPSALTQWPQEAMSAVATPLHHGKALSSSHYVQSSFKVQEEKIVPGEGFTVLVTLKIGPGWHINPHNVAMPFLVPTNIVLRGDHVRVREVSYPAPNGTAVAQASSRKPLRAIDTYEGEITIPIHAYLNRTVFPGNIENMRLLITFQACNNATCLSPANIVHDIPVVVTSAYK